MAAGAAFNPQVQWAKDAIAAKANEAKAVLGNATSGVQPVEPANTDSGWVQHFEFGAVYFTEGVGAHEVNGEIAIKYDKLGGPSWAGALGNLKPLGYPISDEHDAGDGRVSDFQHGSIFWHKRTGPMLVHEVLRPAYDAAGTQSGALGFPTRDTHVWQPADPSKSHLVWVLFENGCIASKPDGNSVSCGPNDIATIPADTLKTLVHHLADKLIHQQDINVGLQPQIDIESVSDWQHSIDASGRRIITYRLYSFKDMGLLLPDVNVRIALEVQFDWKNVPSFTDDPAPTLIAVFPTPPVTESRDIDGVPIATGSVAYDIGDSVDVSAIPVDLPPGETRVILDIIVSPAGDLQFFTNPFGFAAGGSFGQAAQQQIDQKVGELLNS